MSLTKVRLEKFSNAQDLGAFAAEHILERLRSADAERGRMVLGCPSGRSPKTTYQELGRLAGQHKIDLSRLHLLIMDEFVMPSGTAWKRCPADAHYSCARFGEWDIRRVLNAGLPEQLQVPAHRLHVPDPNEPEDYEKLIDALDGIDVFILASGASDGHVAFNPPGTASGALTRVVRLSDTTRQDNMSTFPAFRALEDVPAWGVTVGPATIARASRSATMLLSGASKGTAFSRILESKSYDPAWPSTIIHSCQNSSILVDAAAAAGLAR